jgi:hypothetical protein
MHAALAFPDNERSRGRAGDENVVDATPSILVARQCWLVMVEVARKDARLARHGQPVQEVPSAAWKRRSSRGGSR